MTPNEWVMSLDNPTRAKYDADRLWRQGLRASDRTIIQLQYGYDDHDTDILCQVLAERERVADNILETYNPELGF